MICSITNFQPRESLFVSPYNTANWVSGTGNSGTWHWWSRVEHAGACPPTPPGNRVRRDFLWLKWVRVRAQAGRLALFALCFRSTCSSTWFDISHFLLVRCVINVDREMPTKQALWTTRTTSFNAFHFLIFVHNSLSHPFPPVHLTHVGYHKHVRTNRMSRRL